MQDTCFVVNPGAGSGRADAAWRRLCGRVPGLGAAHLVHAADPLEAGHALVGLLARQPLGRVVVLGGDGSLHQVINVLFGAGLQAQVSVGVVPLGSGADLARGLGLARDPEQALRHALTAAPRALDVLRVSGGGQSRYVANIASAGISGLVAARVNRLSRRTPLTYLSAALGALAGYRPLEARIQVDGQDWFEGRLLLLAVANGSTFGRGMRIAPHARPDDGQAEVVLAVATSPLRVIPRLPHLYLGTHLGLDFIRCASGRRIRIEPLGEAQPYEMDGELMEAGAVDIEVLPGQLRLAV